MVGGDPYEAWAAGAKETYRMQKVPMKQKADVTIVSAGGYPKDTNVNIMIKAAFIMLFFNCQLVWNVFLKLFMLFSI